MTRPLAILRRARERITRKWIQHNYERHGGYCAVGAIGERAEVTLLTFARALGYQGDHAGQATGFIITWNDTAGRTQEEVVAAFDAAIESMEIGKEEEEVYVEPLEDPVPAREKPAPAREPVPEREKVPA